MNIFLNLAILESITNLSLRQIAQSEGIKVEARKVHVSELEHFNEVAACGTAVVVTPISHIHLGEKVHYLLILKSCRPNLVNKFIRQ